MYSLSMEFPNTSLPIVALSSSLGFSVHSERHSTWSFTSSPDIILKVTDKRNGPIKHWNSTSRYSAITSKTTGSHSFCLRNLPTTILRALLPVLRQQRLPSKPYRPPWTWSCIVLCQGPRCQPRWAAPRTKVHHCRSTTPLSRTRRRPSCSGSWFHRRRTCFR